MSCILYDFTICAANCQPLCANVCAGKTNRKEGVRTSADSGEIGIRILASRRRQVTSALTRRRRLIHYRARSNPLVKRKRGIRILASRRRSVRLGSDVPKGTSFTTEPVRIPCAKRKRTPSVSFSFWPALGDSNPQPSESESDTLSNCAKGRY